MTTTTHTYTVTMCDGESFTCVATFDWSNVTDADIREIAARSLIINMQAKQRAAYAKHGKKPVDSSVTVSAPRERTPSDPVSKVADLLSKLTPEQLAAVMAKQGHNNETLNP